MMIKVFYIGIVNEHVVMADLDGLEKREYINRFYHIPKETARYLEGIEGYLNKIEEEGEIVAILQLAEYSHAVITRRRV